MEEQQIRNFVHRISQDITLREELALHAEEVVSREHFTPRVAQIILKLLPVMQVAHINKSPSFSWWL